MFKKDIKVIGKHAYLIKKYSGKYGSREEISHVKIIDSNILEKKEKDLILFETNFDALTSAMLIGISMKKTSTEDKGDFLPANILADKLNDDQSQDLFNKIYQIYLLSVLNLPIEETVKELFNSNNDDKEIKRIESLLMSYAYAGLEEIDKIFSNSNTTNLYLINLLKFLKV
jgi:hypothetical protein